MLLLGLLGLSSSGCWRGRRATYGTVPAVDARQVERLRRLAERDIHCPRGELVAVPMAASAAEVRGCGRIREYSLVCGRRRRCDWQPMVPAAMLATRDLGCPLEAMSVASPSPTTRDLMGCGRMTRYTLSCDEESPCRWSLATAVAPDSAAVPPPSYGGTYAPPAGAPADGAGAPTASSQPVTPSAAGEIPPPPGSAASEVPPPPATAVPPPPGGASDEIPPPPPGSTQPR
jgi:hypothetical protein